MPACYTTCDLYVPRMDGHCRRFVNGIETIPIECHPQGYVAKVSFKRWGKLQAYTNSRLIPTEEAIAIERRVHRIQAWAAKLPGWSISIAGRRGIVSRLTRRWKKRISVGAGSPLSGEPDCLLLEVFNPGQAVVPISLMIVNKKGTGRPPFQRLLELLPGLNSIEIETSKFSHLVDLRSEIQITLDPNIVRKEDEGLTLFFGLLAFVKNSLPLSKVSRPEDAVATDPSKAIKVAVWDLDNTLWSGTLIEDGVSGVSLRKHAITVVRELDRRGIVNSILSKNHPEDAWAALQHFKVDEYFVFPKIGWGEKGAYMKGVIRDFNVAPTTFAFIDDQEFERAQVAASNPGVRSYDSHDLLSLLELPEFNPPQSNESGSRRKFYRSEEHRSKDCEMFGGEYLEFLRTCKMRAEIVHSSGASFDRVQELVQRTNQLNYSGIHYTREEISALLKDEANEAFVISCVDIYGDYGTVGFILVEKKRACLRDAMFSCRIQFKRVEHAMLTFLLHRYRALNFHNFDARFLETKKNSAAASVFLEMSFQEISREGASRLYRFDLSKPIPNDEIVSIFYQGAKWEPPLTR